MRRPAHRRQGRQGLGLRRRLRGLRAAVPRGAEQQRPAAERRHRQVAAQDLRRREPRAHGLPLQRDAGGHRGVPQRQLGGPPGRRSAHGAARAAPGAHHGGLPPAGARLLGRLRRAGALPALVGPRVPPQARGQGRRLLVLLLDGLRRHRHLPHAQPPAAGGRAPRHEHEHEQWRRRGRRGRGGGARGAARPEAPPRAAALARRLLPPQRRALVLRQGHPARVYGAVPRPRRGPRGPRPGPAARVLSARARVRVRVRADGGGEQCGCERREPAPDPRRTPSPRECACVHHVLYCF
mmetsp:Transcript_27620/g.87555  ORF Transcript_27620/g.87555 Transcript_27620/m.87555 type:complete len:295 (-) Transcript_27620:351-1235(-)